MTNVERTHKGLFSKSKGARGRKGHKTIRSSNSSIRGHDRTVHKTPRQKGTTKG